jgi:hypothetical protein
METERDEQGRGRLCTGEENVPHVALKCSEEVNRTIFEYKCFIDEEAAYKRTMDFTNTVELRNTEKYLYKA